MERVEYVTLEEHLGKLADKAEQIAWLTERIAALEAAARAVVSDPLLMKKRMPDRDWMWCAWCDVQDVDPDWPRPTVPYWHLPGCPLGALAALLDGEE